MQEASDRLPEAMWQTFKSKLIDLRNRFVPRREFKIETKKMKGSFPISKTLQIAIKEKHNIHRRRIRSKRRGSLSVTREIYNKARKKVKQMMRRSKRSFEKSIASDCKRNPKPFWKYVRSKLRTKSGISPLLQENDNTNSLKFDDKAEILQKQFCSVFTKEHDGELPSMEKRTEKTITNLPITEDEVRREILQLTLTNHVVQRT